MLFDYLKHAMIRKRRSHEPPQMVSDQIIFQQAEMIGALEIKRPEHPPAAAAGFGAAATV